MINENNYKRKKEKEICENFEIQTRRLSKANLFFVRSNNG